MPETFTFTARATSASGAFADRDFSITVSNTQVDRLLAVGPSGAARALNANNPWVLIPGVKGDSAAYGDRWLIWDQAAGTLWRSVDAINWVAITPTLPTGYTIFGFLRWRAGAWWGLVSGDRTSHWEGGIVTSTDGGASWSLVGPTATDSGYFFSFERTDTGASIIATGNTWFHRPDDGAAWATVRTTSQSYRFQIAHLNGIWFGPDSAVVNSLLARSTDGTAWFAQSNPTVLTGGGYYRGAAWGNGYTVAYAYYDPVPGYSTDAGLTVQAGGTLPTGSLTYDTECPIVCQQGRFVMLGDIGRTFAANVPAGPWTASNLPTGIGATTLAVRP